MNKPYEIGKWAATLCLGFVSLHGQAAEVGEISAEIETFAYELGEAEVTGWV